MEIVYQSMIITFSLVIFLIIIDTIMGVSIALKKGEFDWNKFLNFLTTMIAPYLLVWSGLSGVMIGASYFGEWLGYSVGLGTVIPISGIIAVVGGAIIARLVASIYAKFKDIGIDISGVVKEHEEGLENNEIFVRSRDD